MAAIVAITVAVAPGAAIAQESSANGYGGAGGQVQSGLGGAADNNGNGGGGGPAAAASQGTGDVDGGSLPFTGLDLMLVLAGGLALVAAGITVASVTPRGQRP